MLFRGALEGLYGRLSVYPADMITGSFVCDETKDAVPCAVG